MGQQTLKVPDIGDFQDVDVIEVHVKEGDTVAIDDPLVTLENDKASLDLPATAAGTIQEMKIKLGDKVNEGDDILVLEVEGDGDAADLGASADSTPTAEAPKSAEAPKTETETKSEPAKPIPNAASYNGPHDIEAEVLVLGSGPGGYTAAFRASDLGKKTVLVERYPSLGGVCLNVGCIPSKALLHAAKVIEDAQSFAGHGIQFAAPKIDLDALRNWKDSVVTKLTGGLQGMSKQRKVEVVQGYGHFLSPYHLEVDNDGDKKVVKFEKCIIAAGSQAVKLPFIPEDERIIDSTGALELRFIPKNMLVIGGGIIGLEMATVYYALGAKISVVEMMDGLMMGADRDIVRPYQKWVQQRYESIMLETRVTKVEALKKGLKVHFEGKNAPEEPVYYDMILVAAGRTPNGKKIDADKAGVFVDERGFIPVKNGTMVTNVPHIFSIGDIVGQPMLAHKAIHEGKTAAEVCAGHSAYMDAKVIPSVAYTDPEVAWVGLTETEAKEKGIVYGKGSFPWAASGRSLALGRKEGLTKVLFDKESGRVLGAGIVGTNAGDLIAEVALAIEMGADAQDVGLTIHPHPTLSETVAQAAEAFEGTITDLYLPKRK